MTRETRQVIAYFCLVTALTLPIWLMGQLFPLNLLPGLPIAAAAVLCPALAAIFLAYQSEGWTDLRALVFQTLDAWKAGWWLVSTALLNPVLLTLAFVATRLSGHWSRNLPASRLWCRGSPHFDLPQRRRGAGSADYAISLHGR